MRMREWRGRICAAASGRQSLQASVASLLASMASAQSLPRLSTRFSVLQFNLLHRSTICSIYSRPTTTELMFKLRTSPRTALPVQTSSSAKCTSLMTTISSISQGMATCKRFAPWSTSQQSWPETDKIGKLTLRLQAPSMVRFSVSLLIHRQTMT